MPCVELAKARPKNKLEQTVLFEFYAPQARTVRLAGDFNDWDPSKCFLRKGSDGKWQISLQLKPGCYEYRYQVDGNWENDQRPVKCVPNAFGGWNCVVEVN